MRLSLALGVFLLVSAVGLGSEPPPAGSAWRADWTLSDRELFEVIKAETSKSTLGHERSVHAGPVDHSDADDPGPEPFPSPERAAQSKPAPSGRIGPAVHDRPPAPRLTAPVPLRL